MLGANLWITREEYIEASFCSWGRFRGASKGVVVVVVVDFVVVVVMNLDFGEVGEAASSIAAAAAAVAEEIVTLLKSLERSMEELLN